jgi:leucyl/phenylalanyl-tRNA--protein transferase
MQEQRQNDEILDPELLLAAYCAGYFPMAESKDGSIHWFSPDPRAILELDEFRVPRSLRQTIQKQKYEITVNSAFEDVMRYCGNREETWISETIVQSYCKLHQLGYAHSVEAWYSNKLVGGLYGVAIGGAFFGESMFSTMSDASKVCLVFLVNRMKELGFTLLDVQYVNPHLLRFGAKEIPRSQYLKRLQHAIKKQCSFL